MGCVGSAGWFVFGVSYEVTAKWPLGLKSSAGSTELNVQDDFFNHKSGALAGTAKTAGCGPGIFLTT